MINAPVSVTMRYNLAAVVALFVVAANATALTERQVSVAQPASCLTVSGPLIGTTDVLTCSAGTTCTATTTETTAFLGQELTFTVGVSSC
jgi:hypothetical protein